MDSQEPNGGGPKEVHRNRRRFADSEVDQSAGRTLGQAAGQRVAGISSAQTLRRLSLRESIDGEHSAADRGGQTREGGDFLTVSAVQLLDVRIEFQFDLHALQGKVGHWMSFKG